MTAQPAPKIDFVVEALPLTHGPLSVSQAFSTLLARWKRLTISAFVGAGIGVAAALLIPPTFTATTTLLPPQQQQSAAASALASLGSLASLAGGSSTIRTPGDQYVALLQSTTIADRLLDRFNLRQVYDKALRVDARLELAKQVRVSLGKKDGLITIEADDQDPKRAADLANAYVEELRRLTGGLAITEAQQRRTFFERHLQQTRDQMVQAQKELLASGYDANALKAEPKATAESYAKLRAEISLQEARLLVMRNSLTENAPEMRNQQVVLDAMRRRLASIEHDDASKINRPNYIGRYREYKYQETLFELYARQFELARADESRDGLLIQVIDTAQPPEKKSKPRKLNLILGSILTLLAISSFWTLLEATKQMRSPMAP